MTKPNQPPSQTKGHCSCFLDMIKWFFRPFEASETSGSSIPIVNSSRFNPIVNASVAVFVFVGILAVGIGLKHLHKYYDLHRFYYSAADLPLQEIVYSFAMLFVKSEPPQSLLLFLGCILLTLGASKSPWGDRKINLLILACVPIVWLMFGGYLLEHYLYYAEEVYLMNVVTRDSTYPRLVGRFVENTSSDMQSNLMNGCYYLTRHNGEYINLMFVPSDSGKWKKSGVEIDLTKLREGAESICKASNGESASSYAKCLEETVEKDRTEKATQFFDENYKERQKVKKAVAQITQLVETARIQTKSLQSFHLLPLGSSPLSGECKSIVESKQPS